MTEADAYFTKLHTELDKIAKTADRITEQVQEIRKARLAQPVLLAPRKTIGYTAGKSE